jgi:hypothetical protein
MGTHIDYSGLQGLVDEGHKEAEKKEARKGWAGRAARRVLMWAAAVVVLATLPFFVLVRMGVFAYREWGLGTWPSLTVAVVATALLLAAYAWGVGIKLGAGKGFRRLLRRGAIGMAVAYAAYGLVYVAGANVKSDEVRAEYSTLHPMLRIATSVVFLVDPSSVMTDAGRTPEDYWLWGLPQNEASLHFEQADGYVHAVDLRTTGRSALRNFTLEMAFWAFGFHSLRHVGTADHLHVSLRLPEG